MDSLSSRGLGRRVLVLGILNVTPDSFSDGGLLQGPEGAVAAGLRMAEEGADALDVGGESTRPGAGPVDEAEELSRVIPVVEALAKRSSLPVSIDTRKPGVARRALEAGASVVNDVGGLSDQDMRAAVKASGAEVVIMHMRGEPRTMQTHAEYADVVREVGEYLRRQTALCESEGIAKARLLIDPGIGFGKTAEQSLELLKRLKELAALGYPVLVGPSRKFFIGKVLDLPVSERLEGTAAAVTAAVLNGASVVRVHDVKAMVRVVRMAEAIRG